MSIIYTPPSPPIVICFTLLSFLMLLFKLYKFSCLVTQALSFLWISSTTYSFSISAPALPSMMPLIWGRWGIQLKPGEHERLGHLFCHGSRWGHSFFWNIWLEWRSYYLKVICLVRLPLSWLFSQSRFLLGVFGLYLLVFPGCQLLHLQGWDL